MENVTSLNKIKNSSFEGVGKDLHIIEQIVTVVNHAIWNKRHFLNL